MCIIQTDIRTRTTDLHLLPTLGRKNDKQTDTLYSQSFIQQLPVQ